MFLNNQLKKINWGTVWFVFQLIILLFIAALGNWFTKDFNPEYIFSPKWWGDTLLQIIYNYSILYTVFNRRIDKLKIEHVVYKEYVKKLKDEVDVLDPNSFNPWFDGFNISQKIKHFKNHISVKLEKLENKVKPKDIYIWEHGTEEEKTKSRYCRKRRRFEEQLTDEYIKKNIRLVNVGYKNIQKSFITNGYNRRGRNRVAYEVENGGLKFIRDLIPRTILTTAIVLIFHSVIIEFAETESILLLILQTLMTIVPMMLHANIGLQYANQYFEEKVLVDARIREEIIALYYNEINKVGETNGQIYN